MPKSHSVRRRKTFGHLLARELGRQQIGVELQRRSIEREDSRARQLPGTGLQFGLLRLDAFLEFAGRVEHEYRDCAELEPLLAALPGIEDRISIGAALTHPITTVVALQRRWGLAENFRFDAFGGFAKRGRERIVDHSSDRPERDGD